MKTLLTIVAVSVGMYLGVNLEADTQALRISRMQHVSYKQVINRSPWLFLKSVLGGK